jgi:hypothetical protein
MGADENGFKRLMNQSFMLEDLSRTSEALVLFALVLFVPGYVLGWLVNAFSVRKRGLLARATAAVPLSIGICPIITYMLWRFSFAAVEVFYGACALAFIALVFLDRELWFSRGAFSSAIKERSVFLAITAGWVVVAIFVLVDLQIGNRLYFPTVTFDYSLRATLTSAITRTGVPPSNPFFFPGRPFPMRYHYFWFIICSIVQKISGQHLSAKDAVIAGTIWSGIGLLAAVPLYMRFFQSRGPERIEKRTLLGVALLAVTGLDIVPVAAIELASRGFFGNLEWWNEQVSAWIVTVVWVPHHLAGLIACLTGFLLIWDANRLPHWRDRTIIAATSGLIFASAMGLSIYVTLVFAPFLAIWAVIAFLRRQRGYAALICFSGLIALVFVIPYVIELFAPQPGVSSATGPSGGIPLRFGVRAFPIIDNILHLEDSGWKASLANLIALPVNYFLELGFFLIVGVIQVKRMWRNRDHLADDQLAGVTMGAVSVIICTFVRSSVIANNDLGWRGFLPAQFILLIWGAELLSEGLLSSPVGSAAGARSGAANHDRRALILATLILGTAGSCYEVFKIRFYPLQSDVTSTPLYQWLSPDRNLGVRTFALRGVYEDLKRQIPAGAIYQHNPNTAPEDLFHGIYADHQVSAETMACGVVFGGDASMCANRIGIIRDLFEKPKAFEASGIDRVCRQLSIDVLIVKDTDPVWRENESWIWKRKPLLSNGYARAFDCGAARLAR